MPNMINEPTTIDRVVPIVCFVILIAFFACLPSMIKDQNKRLEQAWQDQGCQMYDNDKTANVPAKCSQYFVDHYKPQQPRPQPPELKEQE